MIVLNVSMEKVINSLKGVSSVIATMSEVPTGSIIWNGMAHELLFDALNRCIMQLEDIAYTNEEESKVK